MQWSSIETVTVLPHFATVLEFTLTLDEILKSLIISSGVNKIFKVSSLKFSLDMCLICGHSVHRIEQSGRADTRRQEIAFLLPTLTAQVNLSS